MDERLVNRDARYLDFEAQRRALPDAPMLSRTHPNPIHSRDLDYDDGYRSKREEGWARGPPRPMYDPRDIDMSRLPADSISVTPIDSSGVTFKRDNGIPH